MIRKIKRLYVQDVKKIFWSDVKVKFETVKISDLKPAEYNPRKKMKKDSKLYNQLRKSIEEFGYVLPIVINKDLTIIGGHQRYEILKDLEYKTCEVVVVELSKVKEKLLNIALNKITGQWDFVVLKDVLLEIDTGEMDIEITGFDMAEVEKIMNEFEFKDEVFTGENTELETDDFSGDKFEHTCPHCGFMFSGK